MVFSVPIFLAGTVWLLHLYNWLWYSVLSLTIFKSHLRLYSWSELIIHTLLPKCLLCIYIYLLTMCNILYYCNNLWTLLHVNVHVAVKFVSYKVKCNKNEIVHSRFSVIHGMSFEGFFCKVFSILFCKFTDFVVYCKTRALRQGHILCKSSPRIRRCYLWRTYFSAKTTSIT